MPKRIVILSDGTGNAAASVWRTNVWRTFELLDLSSRDQVAKYDDGVGNSSFKPLAVLGGAFGWGLKRNVIDLYKFICRNYQDGSQIFAFGFSRGAFTIRIVVALILCEGLVPYRSEADLHARATAAYRAFREEHFHTVFRIEWIFRRVRNALGWLLGRRYDRSENRQVPSVEFVGLWDTVAAYGLPIEEMTRGVSQYLLPLYLPERALHPGVKRACHALALDDERTTFHPVLWTEKGERSAAPDSEGRTWIKDERISQVWFAGVHANVGGGYPDDALAHLPLFWIMQEASSRGLVFKTPPTADPNAFLKISSTRDPDGRAYDSRSGLGGYYRYGPRNVSDFGSGLAAGTDAVEILQPKIHESVFVRLRSDANAYAPIGIPADYAVVTTNGEILQGAKNPYETPPEAHARSVEQQRVWNWVWLRRLAYFATLLASFHLLAFWLFHRIDVEREYSSGLRLVSEFVRTVEAFLPRQVVRWWTDWFATNPRSFLIGVIVLAVLIWYGSKLGARITDSMRHIWKGRAQTSTIQNSPIAWPLFRFRTSKAYRKIVGASKRHILPFFAAAFVLWLGATATSHLLFNIIDSMGAFCHESPVSELQSFSKTGSESKEIRFETNAVCAPTRVRVDRGKRYHVIITIPQDTLWTDGSIPTTPAGFGTRSAPDVLSMTASLSVLPLRRVIFRPWFRLIARVGATGIAEAFVDPSPWPGKPNMFGGVISPERSGELFLYVNEAVLPLPWIYDWFHRNNRGSASITIRRLN